MDKKPNRADLIAQLSDDLAPVAPIKPALGAGLIAIAAFLAMAAAIALYSFWFGIIYGEASGYFWITSGLLLAVGSAATAGLIASAQPRVGERSSAPLWAGAMLSVLPLAAMLAIFTASSHDGEAGAHFHGAWFCTSRSVAAGFIVAAAGVLWLRRGAPISTQRAGWMLGLAAGSLGTLAYSVTCPNDEITHIGLWHTLPVAVWAVMGRIIAPPLIRW